jgi:hypothetical protein
MSCHWQCVMTATRRLHELHYGDLHDTSLTVCDDSHTKAARTQLRWFRCHVTDSVWWQPHEGCTNSTAVIYMSSHLQSLMRITQALSQNQQNYHNLPQYDIYHKTCPVLPVKTRMFAKWRPKLFNKNTVLQTLSANCFIPITYLTRCWDTPFSTPKPQIISLHKANPPPSPFS